MPVFTQQFILGAQLRVESIGFQYSRREAWIDYSIEVLDALGQPVSRIRARVPQQDAIAYLQNNLPTAQSHFDKLEQYLMSKLPPESGATFQPNTDVDITPVD